MILMQLLNVRNGFLAFTLIAIASVAGSVLTACSTTASQAQKHYCYQYQRQQTDEPRKRHGS